VILAPCAAPKRSRPATRISRPQGTPTHDPRSNPGAASSDHERVGRFRRTPAAPNMLRCARIHALADGGYRQDPDVLGHGGLDLCRPMFAPCLLGRPGTSRYAPAAPGIRSPPRIRATAQNSRPRHESSSHDTRSERRIEQSSGLLICGFGVQVPGGAPILTWGFTVSGHLFDARFVQIFCPCSLRACSAVGCWRARRRADWSRPAVWTPSAAVTQRDSSRQESCGQAATRGRCRRGHRSGLSSALNPHSRCPPSPLKHPAGTDTSGSSCPARSRRSPSTPSGGLSRYIPGIFAP